ncbi:MAG: fibronectin type III domain-containing protein [Clostridiales bacterium]|nr:fibronectin type III domain-containing protein [Clostridiales bacterium]
MKMKALFLAAVLLFTLLPAAALAAGPASPPQNLTATPSDATSMKLTWSAPANFGGLAITGYEVSKDGGATWIPTGSIAQTYWFTSLTPFAVYSFGVRAVNALYLGEAAYVTATMALPGQFRLQYGQHLYIFNGGYVIESAPNLAVTTGHSDYRSYTGDYLLTGGTSGTPLTNTTVTVMADYTSGGRIIMLDGLHIFSTATSPVALQTQASVNMDLAGDNELGCPGSGAALGVPLSAALTLGGGGTLIAANNGAGAGIGGGFIGGSGTVTISGGTVCASSYYGAGIGGGQTGGGTVTISGGTVCASSYYGAGIGSGDSGGGGGTVTISGGTICASSDYGAGIGGGYRGGGGTVTISGGTVCASSYYGAGIGSGQNGGGTGTVTISGGSIHADIQAPMGRFGFDPSTMPVRCHEFNTCKAAGDAVTRADILPLLHPDCTLPTAYIFSGVRADAGGKVYLWLPCDVRPGILRGDANCDGKVSAEDAALVLRALAGLSTLSEQGELNADVTGGGVGAEDAAMILRFLAGLIGAL